MAEIDRYAAYPCPCGELAFAWLPSTGSGSGCGLTLLCVMGSVIKYVHQVMAKNEVFIHMQDAHYRYPEQEEGSPDVLNSVTFEIRPGEYLAIVGANGSGKSTLVKIMDGLLIPTAGEVRVAGVNITPQADLAEVRRKVGIVFQSPEDQIVATTVEEDIAFGLENFGVPTREMHSRVRKVLEGFDLWDVRQRPSYMLSGGQTQRLALASVLAIEPECIIFDESTSMLDPAARKNLLGVMNGFHNEGKTIIHVTHSMEEAAQAARVLVMEAGRIVFDGSPEKLFSQNEIDDWGLEYPESIELLIQLRLAGLDISSSSLSIPELVDIILKQCKIKDGPNVSTGDANDAVTIVALQDLSFVYLLGTPQAVPALNGVSFSVPQGSGHGLIGKTGSGKSTVLQHLNGLLKPQAGNVQVGRFDLGKDDYSIRDVVQVAGLVMQNPENQFFEYYVGDEIAFGPKNIGYEGSLADRVRWAMEMVGLDFDAFKDRPVHTLSGGQKRKVALASILALKPVVFLLDEPTAGLDPRARKEVLTRFKQMQQDGMTIIVSSHNLEDILTLTQGITLLERGCSVENGKTRSILADMDTLLNQGIDPPYITKLVHELSRKSGKTIQDICTGEELAARLELREHVRA